MRNIKLPGFDALVHKEHYLLCFTDITNKDSLHNISRYKLGFNLFSFYDEKELSIRNNFGCDNNCHYECSNVPRYICLNCEDGFMPFNGLTDICDRCFHDIYINDGNFKKTKPHKKNHVYLCLFYSGIDYYNY
jgi:hypothetical protein